MTEVQRPSNYLIIVCGLSFAGKSTLGNAISAEFGYPQVDVDETKLDLYGPGIDDEELSQDEWTRIYTETDDRMLILLRNGKSVVDASRNFRKHERDHARQITKRAGAEVVLVHLDAPESLVRQRWAENRAKQIRRDVSDKGFEEIISAMEPPTADEKALVFHHNDTVEDWFAQYAERLAGRLT